MARPHLRLATSSYADFRPAEGDVGVRISLGKPKFKVEPWPRFQLAEATIKGWMFHLPPDEFEAAYLGQLNRYGVERIARRLHEIADATGASLLVLLCFERTDAVLANPAACHRRLFADWYEEQTGVEVVELWCGRGSGPDCLSDADPSDLPDLGLLSPPDTEGE